MRNILEKVRKSDYEEVKAGRRPFIWPKGGGKPKPLFAASAPRWRREYGDLMRRLEQDLPELLSFVAFPRHLWSKLRTTNVIERCSWRYDDGPPGRWSAL
jgi:transposase-like protein